MKLPLPFLTDSGASAELNETNVDYSPFDINFCADPTEYLATNAPATFEDATIWCQKLGGENAVAKNQSILDKMVEAAKKSGCDEFFVGYENKNGDWIDNKD